VQHQIVQRKHRSEIENQIRLASDGLDTISTGSTIALACDLFDKDILTVEHTGGLEIIFVDVFVLIYGPGRIRTCDLADNGFIPTRLYFLY